MKIIDSCLENKLKLSFKKNFGKENSSEKKFAEVLKKIDEKPNENLISVGLLNKNAPTVSNLLIKNPEFKTKCWKIINSSVNKNKSFNHIYSNTEIYLNKDTNELSWKNGYVSGVEKKIQKSPFEKTDEKDPNKHNSVITTNKEKNSFEKAVKSCIGTKYSDLDCYELLVNGMEKIGVKYRGRGGLSEYLSQQALNRGLPSNSYKTGEGIVKMSGEKIYSKILSNSEVKDYNGGKLLNEISEYLQRGDILSFSTRTKGHTGMISQKNNEWTFVNSGILDNTIGNNKIKKGVGEEFLKNELENWLKIAAKRNESLMISSGRLDQKKLSQFLIENKIKDIATPFMS